MKTFIVDACISSSQISLPDTIETATIQYNKLLKAFLGAHCCNYKYLSDLIETY